MSARNVVIPNKISQIATAIEGFDSFSLENKLSPQIVYPGELALEEILTNVINYAFPAAGDHLIQVAFEIQNEELIFRISDDGVPFDPTLAPEPKLDLDLSDRQIGGLGIHLVRSMMDEMSHHRINQQNQLVLRKKLK